MGTKKDAMDSVARLLLEAVGERSDCRPRTTIVYGNLGRLPRELVRCVEDVLLLTCREVRFHTDFWDRIGIDERYEDDGTRCDLLLWLEPNFGDAIVRPSYAGRMAVLTSHLHLAFSRDDARLVAHHAGDAERDPEPPEDYVEPPADRLPRIGEDGALAPALVPGPFYRADVGIPAGSRVCVDLSGCRTAREAYLGLLNARDLLRYEVVSGWWVVMGEAIRRSLRLNLGASERNLDRFADESRGGMPCNAGGVDVLRDRYVRRVIGSFPTAEEEERRKRDDAGSPRRGAGCPMRAPDLWIEEENDAAVWIRDGAGIPIRRRPLRWIGRWREKEEAPEPVERRGGNK